MDSSEIFFVPVKTLFKLICWFVVVLLAIIGSLYFITITEKYYAQGRVVPRDEAVVFATDDSAVKEVLVKSGKTVKAGELLMTLKTEDLDQRAVLLTNELDKTEAAMAVQKAQNAKLAANPLSADLRHVGAALDLAKVKAEHFNNYVATLSTLVNSGIISKIEFENAKMQAAQAEAELKQSKADESILAKGYAQTLFREAQALVEAMEAQRKTLGRQRKLLDEEYARRKIVAPAAGLVIVHRKRDPGEPVKKGEDLYHIALNDAIKIDLIGPEQDVNKVSPGQVVEIQPLVYTNSDYDFAQGKVLFVSTEPRTDGAGMGLAGSPSGSCYKIECSVDNVEKNEKIPLGSSIQARILLHPKRLLLYLLGIGR